MQTRDKSRVNQLAWAEYNYKKTVGSQSDLTASFFALPLGREKNTDVDLTPESYLNKECNQFLQLGCSTGSYLDRLLSTRPNAKAIGYEYTNDGYSAMQQWPNSARITPRLIDLNKTKQSANNDNNSKTNTQENKLELAYINDLKHDLAVTSNIILVNILQYLNEDARLLLLISLIENCQNNSVFFIENHVIKSPEKLDPDHLTFVTSRGPLVRPMVGFFTDRRDIQILESKRITNKVSTSTLLGEAKKFQYNDTDLNDIGIDNEIIIFKKNTPVLKNVANTLRESVNIQKPTNETSLKIVDAVVIGGVFGGNSFFYKKRATFVSQSQNINISNSK